MRVRALNFKELFSSIETGAIVLERKAEEHETQIRELFTEFRSVAELGLTMQEVLDAVNTKDWKIDQKIAESDRRLQSIESVVEAVRSSASAGMLEKGCEIMIAERQSE